MLAHLILALVFGIPIAIVLLLNKGHFKSGGALLAAAGVACCAAGSGGSGEAGMVFAFGIFLGVAGIHLYLEGFKRDVMEDFKALLEKKQEGE